MSHSLSNATKARFRERTSEYSTRASRRGTNMLGWEQPEALTRAEELACLKAKVKAIHDESKNLPLGNPRKRELGLAQQELGRQIHSLKGTAPKESRDALEHRFTNYLLTEVKRLVTSSEWDAAYKRAAQRLNDDHLQKTDPSDAQGRQ